MLKTQGFNPQSYTNYELEIMLEALSRRVREYELEVEFNLELGNEWENKTIKTMSYHEIIMYMETTSGMDNWDESVNLHNLLSNILSERKLTEEEIPF
ncbi:hypothetical protein P4672_06000 [Priestia megaterium]|uniref:hypothetical protein n=1 Tax=Priestia megaterium TaxID=1404 RepID=UPI002E1AEE11|nr:hypothetical protein [Priestia megaterium]